jgi:hypothetical protein
MAARRNFAKVFDRSVSAREFADRCRERDQREATDTRSEIERWLGDPPRDRSALANNTPRARPQRSSASHARVDLWKR